MSRKVTSKDSAGTSSASLAYIEKILDQFLPKIDKYVADLHSGKPVSPQVRKKLVEDMRNKFLKAPPLDVLRIVTRRMRGDAEKIDKDVSKNYPEYSDNEENLAELMQGFRQLYQFMRNKAVKEEAEMLQQNIEKKIKHLHNVFEKVKADITKTDYQRWFTLCLTSYYLERVKHFVAEIGDRRMSAIETSFYSMKTMVEYKNILVRNHGSLAILRHNIFFHLRLVSSEFADKKLSPDQRSTQFDHVEQEGDEKYYVQMLKDCILKQFEVGSKALHKAFDFHDKRSHLPCTKYTGDITKMCCYLQFLMMSDFPSDMNAVTCTFDAGSMKTKMKYAVSPEKNFEDDLKALLGTVKMDAMDVTIVMDKLKWFKELCNFRENLGQFGKYIWEKMSGKEIEFLLPKIYFITNHLKHLNDTEHED